MLNEQTLQTLNSLKLFGMARSFTDKIAHPSSADLSHHEFFGLIVQDEKTYRDNLRLNRLLLNAKLSQPACLEDMHELGGVARRGPEGPDCRQPPRGEPALFCELPGRGVGRCLAVLELPGW